MQPERPNPPRELRVRLDAVEEVQPAVERLLVLAEVEVDGAEDVPLGDEAEEGGEEEPGAEVEAGGEGGDAVPEFRGKGGVEGRTGVSVGWVMQGMRRWE